MARSTDVWAKNGSADAPAMTVYKLAKNMPMGGRRTRRLRPWCQ